MTGAGGIAGFIWSLADKLRGPYKPVEHREVILPLTALRRLDCVLEPTRQQVLGKLEDLKALHSDLSTFEPILDHAAGLQFHNTSRISFETLRNSPDAVAADLVAFLQGFSTGHATSWTASASGPTSSGSRRPTDSATLARLWQPWTCTRTVSRTARRAWSSRN